MNTGGRAGQSPGNWAMSQQKPAFGGCVMNRTKFEYSYWDASVFLAYLNNEPNRSDTVQTVLDEIAPFARSANSDFLTDNRRSRYCRQLQPTATDYCRAKAQ